MRRAIEWLVLIGFAVSVYFWLKSAWAAISITAILMLFEQLISEIVQAIRSCAKAGFAIAEALEQTNKEIPRLDNYKGLWPL